jgi:hypothetical protein
VKVINFYEQLEFTSSEFCFLLDYSFFYAAVILYLAKNNFIHPLDYGHETLFTKLQAYILSVDEYTQWSFKLKPELNIEIKLIV